MIAKTGTAEFGDQEPLQTHAWMVGAQGDLAVAAFVELGESGSRTAGPAARAAAPRRAVTANRAVPDTVTQMWS